MKIEKCIVIAMLFAVVGCAGKGVEPKAISEQVKLEAHASGNGALVWKKADLVPGSYSSVVVEPVQYWLDMDDEKYADLDGVELEALAVYGRDVLKAALSKRYEILQTPKPGTVIVRTSITDVEEAVPALRMVSSVLPFGVLLSYGKEAVTGKHSWVGEVQYEMQFIDGMTGELLGVVVHHKAGEKWDIDGMTDDLGHIRSEFDLVAMRMGKELWFFDGPEEF